MDAFRSGRYLFDGGVGSYTSSDVVDLLNR